MKTNLLFLIIFRSILLRIGIVAETLQRKSKRIFYVQLRFFSKIIPFLR